MQLPVISTAYMGVKDTVTPETGILVEPGDPVALSKAIVKLATTAAQERQAMGTAGRKRVCDQFTLASQAKALSGLFRSLPGAVMP